MHGYFHEEATLCSQVSRDAGCDAGSRVTRCCADAEGFYSILGWDGWEQGQCKAQGLAQLSAGLLLPMPTWPVWGRRKRRT